MKRGMGALVFSRTFIIHNFCKSNIPLYRLDVHRLDVLTKTIHQHIPTNNKEGIHITDGHFSSLPKKLQDEISEKTFLQ